jgi:hypothetical protein
MARFKSPNRRMMSATRCSEISETIFWMTGSVREEENLRLRTHDRNGVPRAGMFLDVLGDGRRFREWISAV